MQEVRHLLAEAAVLETEHDLEAAQSSAFQALALYLSLPETQEMSEEDVAHELYSLAEGKRPKRMWGCPTFSLAKGPSA